MDAILAATLGRRVRESFSTKDEVEDTASKASKWIFSPTGSIVLLILIAISVWAAYLSWSCNTVLGYSVFARVIFSLFAALFGLTYLFWYWIMRSDACSVLIKQAVAAAPSASAPGGLAVPQANFTY